MQVGDSAGKRDEPHCCSYDPCLFGREKHCGRSRCQHQIKLAPSFTIEEPRHQNSQSKKHKQDLVNEIAGEKHKTRRDGRERGCRKRSRRAEPRSQTEKKPNDADPEDRRDKADHKRAQSVSPMQDIVDRRGNHRQIVERGTVIVCRIVVIEAGAEQSGQKDAVHAFVVVQRFFTKEEQAQQRGPNQECQAAPPPGVARGQAQRSAGSHCSSIDSRLPLASLGRNLFHPWAILNQELCTSSACRSARLLTTSINSRVTERFLDIASEIGTEVILLPLSATIRPNLPSCTRSMAPIP